VDGVLVVDKPAGPTSHDIVDRARRVFAMRRVGHTGTLDPFATGVLPLCLGRATRLARFLAAGEKIYRATVRLGFATTTDDLTGEPLGALSAPAVEPGALEAALCGLVGVFDQVPPAFSARQVGGRRLHDLARRGEAVARAATPVTVHALDLVARDGDRLELEVRCSAGTYVRALARDLGERLGCGAHLVALRRTRSGSFDLRQAVSGESFEQAAERVIPLSGLLVDWPAAVVDAAGLERVRHGRELEAEHVVAGFPRAPVPRMRVLNRRGGLVALAVPRGFEAGGSQLPRRPVLHPDLVLLDADAADQA
jgi:tRNA pseudouridine55 synthase